MEDLLRKTFLAGIGFISLSEEKFRENIEKFVTKGEMTEKEGRDLLSKFKDRYKDFLSDLDKKIDIQMEKFIQKSGLATKSDLERVEQRVAALEERLASKD